MRPLKLVVEGFTCFRNTQELDFSKLDLFAMSGATGAGKSSLLEAMTYALYGKLPRIDAVTELISQGADRLRVTLDFALGDRQYRIHRSLRRSTQSQAQLDETTGGTEELRADGTREVNPEVERMLGLSYKGFVQAVVLPQGEFSKFLKSAPAERRRLLTQLLSLELYGDMQKRANESAKECEGRIGELSAFLERDYSRATDVGVDAANKAAAQAREVEKERRAEAVEERKRHNQSKRLNQLTNELLLKTRELQRLEQTATAHKRDQERLAAARRAEPVAPFNVRLEEARARLKDLKEAAESAETAQRDAELALKQAEQRVTSAKKGTSEIASLTERIDELEKALAELPHLERARIRATRHEDERDALTEAHVEQLDLVRDAASTERELLKKCSAAQKKLEGSGHDAETLKRLVAASKKTAPLRREREVSAERQEVAEDAETSADTATEAFAEAKGRAERATADVAQRIAAAEETKQALERLQSLNAAAHLRANLNSGDECPVCEQPVSKVPRQQKVASHEDAASRHEAAETKRLDAQSKADKLKASLDYAQKVAEERTAALAVARASAKKAKEALTRSDAALGAEVKELIKAGALAVEDRIDQALEVAREAEVRHGELAEVVRTAEKDLSKAQQKVEAAKAKADDLEQRCKDAKDEAVASRGEAAKLEAKVRRLAGTKDDPDPEEPGRLRARRESLEEAQRTATAQHTKADKAYGLAEARLKGATSALEGASGRASVADEKAEEAAQRAGFRSLKDACASMLEAEKRSEIEEGTTKWAANRAEATERISALEKELGPERVSDSDLQTADEREDKVVQAAEDAQAEAVRLVQEAKHLAAQLERAKSMREELKKHEHQRDVWRGLGHALRSDGFVDWMLEGTFRRLMADASVRLRQMSSGRYTFDLRPDDNRFDVLDEENARDRRAVETLSGGETFLASLALALALSEQVQGAGSTRLESLFIDEGFGSLDPQSLDTAISAIESLHTGGRMVGVISHIETLGERLSQRVIVEKRLDGSRLRVET